MFSRRNLLGLTVGLLAVPALPASAVGTYSQGWRMGMLTKFSRIEHSEHKQDFP